MNFKDLSLEQLIEERKNGKISKEEVFEYFIKRREIYDS